MTLPVTPMIYAWPCSIDRADTDTVIVLWGWRFDGTDSGPVYESRDAAFDGAPS